MLRMIRVAGLRFAMALISVGIFAFGAVGAAWAEDDPDEMAAPTVMGDFNRDGISDVAAVTWAGDGKAGSGLGLLTVMLGRADGSFRQVFSTELPGHAATMMVAGDFNRDGILDLVVGDRGGSLVEFLGDGTGKLISMGEIARLGAVASIAVGDFNHDGVLDLAASDPGTGRITVLLGAGKGVFQSAWSFSFEMPGIEAHLTAADFNGDGVPDLAVMNEDEGTMSVMLSNGNGTFTEAPGLGFSPVPGSHCGT
jgi:hypothetical protein